MRDARGVAQAVGRDGFAAVDDAVQRPLIDQMIRALESEPDEAGQPGIRNLFEQVPATRLLITHPSIRAHVEAVLGPGAFAVRAILFDKIEGKNWKVGWHQDQAIAIKAAVDAPGFGPASVKQGVPHTRAPAEVLQQMLAVRIHLDPCGPENGPLRCAPASHLLGRLDPQDAPAHARRLGERACTVGVGGLVLMRPLCLHASSPAVSPNHRRVVHIEFAGCELPGPLAWYQRLPVGG